jgi:hypothetical protein
MKESVVILALLTVFTINALSDGFDNSPISQPAPAKARTELELENSSTGSN